MLFLKLQFLESGNSVANFAFTVTFSQPRNTKASRESPRMGITGAVWKLVRGPGTREQQCPRMRQRRLVCPGPGVEDQQDSAVEVPDWAAGMWYKVMRVVGRPAASQ